MNETANADHTYEAPSVEQLKATFVRKYATIAALRLLNISGPEHVDAATLDEVDDEVATFLRTEFGQRELSRWVATFMPAFGAIDESYAEILQPPEQTRSVGDWLAGVRAEELAVEALVTRCRRLMARHDKSRLARLGRHPT